MIINIIIIIIIYCLLIVRGYLIDRGYFPQSKILILCSKEYSLRKSKLLFKDMFSLVLFEANM